jgi:hypothetical protein
MSMHGRGPLSDSPLFCGSKSRTVVVANPVNHKGTWKSSPQKSPHDALLVQWRHLESSLQPLD